MTLEGHPFSDWITLSAYEDGRFAVRRVNDSGGIWLRPAARGQLRVRFSGVTT
jgi:hypothetical protein